MAHLTLTRLVLVCILSADLVCFNLAAPGRSGIFAASDAGREAAGARKAKLQLPERIAQTVAQLRRITVDGMENGVPPEARPLLTRLKHQLRDLISMTLNEPGGQVANLESEIRGRLNAAGVTVSKAADDEPSAGEAAQQSISTPSPSEPVQQSMSTTPTPEAVLPVSGTGLIAMGGTSAPPAVGSVPALAAAPALASETYAAGNTGAAESPKSGYVLPDYSYGTVEGLDVQQPDGHPDLIGVTTTLGVCCGSDTSLYVFLRSENRWHLVLAQESNGYEAVDGAQGSFEYRVSPPDSQGRFFVVTANVNPWCSSNWQSVRYQVMRPGATAYTPRVILNDSGTIYRVDPEFKLEADIDSFTLRFTGEGRDPVHFTRDHVVKYGIGEDQVRRLPPLAEEPEDFVAEWLDLEWSDAARWADAAAWSDLERVHAALHVSKDYHRGNEIPLGQPCADGNAWQISIEVSERDQDDWEQAKHDGAENQTTLPDNLFFTIEKRKGVFVVRSVTFEPPPDCSKVAVSRMNLVGDLAYVLVQDFVTARQ